MNDAGEYKCQVENTNPKLEQVISKISKYQCNITLRNTSNCYYLMLIPIRKPNKLVTTIIELNLIGFLYRMTIFYNFLHIWPREKIQKLPERPFQDLHNKQHF